MMNIHAKEKRGEYVQWAREKRLNLEREIIKRIQCLFTDEYLQQVCLVMNILMKPILGL